MIKKIFLICVSNTKFTNSNTKWKIIIQIQFLLILLTFFKVIIKKISLTQFKNTLTQFFFYFVLEKFYLVNLIYKNIFFKKC